MRRQHVNSVRFRCLTSKLADDGHQTSVVRRDGCQPLCVSERGGRVPGGNGCIVAPLALKTISKETTWG
jgi:hypothetical protein